MANKKVVGELVYEIRGDDTQYSKVINKSDVQARKLGKTVSGVSDNMIRNLAGAFLGWQALTKGIDATIGSAVRYEDAFAGVRKTVDGTEEQLQALSKRFRELSKEIPITAEEFARIGELAGQLGVPIEQIEKFTKTIGLIGVTTNLTTEQASTDIARFANIMGMPLENVDRLGSSIVALGNDSATTEQEILDMALRISGAGATLKLTEAQVLGWSSALSSVGIQAQMGGTAFSKLLIDISSMVSTGSAKLKKFAKVAGMTADDFSKAFKEDANEAMKVFFKGLSNVKEGGGDLLAVIDSLGIKETRLRDTVLRLSGGYEKLNKQLDISEKATIENTALYTEAEKRFKTTASQIQLLKNNLGDLGRTLGIVVLPVVNTAIKFFIQMADTVRFATTAIKNAFIIMGDGIALALIGSLQTVEKFINGAIGLANSFFAKLGVDKNIKKISLLSDNLRASTKHLSDQMSKAGQETSDAFWKAGGATKQLDKNLKNLTGTQTLLNKNTKEATGEYDNLVNSLGDSEEASEEAREEAEKLAENYKKLGLRVEDLAYNGKRAITDLSESNIKDLEKIEDKIETIKSKIEDLQTSLAEDLAQQDIGIAEKIVAEERKIADLKQELEEERKKEEPRVKTITALTAEIKTREDALKANAELETQLAEQIQEARRRADLTDLERSVEDYLTKKAQIQLEFDEKKLQLENELALEEENKQKTINLLQDKQDQINQIIELGNQRFQDLADNRVKITEDEVTKQIAWYNKLADAMAKSKSASRTTELPQFHNGGYVATGGEVHAGEYVIPANMVNAYGGLIKALEGVRGGGGGTTNNVTLNNSINEQIDMDAVLKSISFELNK